MSALGGQPANDHATYATGRGRLSWALYDWANSAFFTLILTFFFARYFSSTVVGDDVEGPALWGRAVGIAGFCVAVSAVFLGAMADAGGPRKPWIGFFTLLSATGCALLWFATPNADTATLIVVMGAIILANLGIEYAIVFYNAMLPRLVPPSEMGRLSGNAWAIGYGGGLVTLLIVVFGFNGMLGTPIFDLDRAAFHHERIIGPFTAIWLLVFALPLFLFTPDVPPTGLSRLEAAKTGVRNVVATVRKVRQYGNVGRFLIARMIYADGQAAVFAFGGIYAAQVFGWEAVQLGVFGIILSIFAAAGAWIGGILDDKIGSKRTINLALYGLMFGTFGMIGTSADTIFFVIDLGPLPEERGLFASTAEVVFILISIVVGMAGGPAQSASRTLMGRLSPPSMAGEFFGLYALSGKATAWLAPLLVSTLTLALDSFRWGLSVILVFFVVGFLLLIPVREERAQAIDQGAAA